MIVQNVSTGGTGRTDISFTLPQADGADRDGRAGARCRTRSASTTLLYDDQIGKVSLIGAGMRSHPGVSATFFAALADAGVNIEMISHLGDPHLGGRRRDTDVDVAVRAVHDAFDLGSDEVEAVVYGGTGR